MNNNIIPKLIMKSNFILFFLLLLHAGILAQEPKWISFTASHVVNDIKEERDFLWLATTGGVIKLNKESGEQEHFTSTNSGLCDNRVKSVAIEESGKKWFATSNGVTSLDDSNWRVYIDELPDENVNSIAIDKQGNKWFGTQSNGSVMFNDSQWTIYNDETKGHPSTITDIVVDDENTIWFATFGKGISKFENNQWTLFNTTNSELSSNWVYDLIVNEDKSVWFNLYTGVYKIDQDVFTMISSDTPKCLAVDLNGNKWFGFRNGGICKYSDNGNLIYPYIPELSNKEVKTIEIVDNGDFWIGTNDGVVYYNQSSSKHYNTATSGLPDSGIYDIYIDADGNKWFGTNNGAARFDGTEWINFTGKDFDVHFTQVKSITSDLDGNVWLATNGGLGMFNGETLSMLNHKNSPLPNTIISDVDVDPTNGDIWITSSEGVFRFNGANWNSVTTDNSEIPLNGVSSVAIEASGVKWFGTGGSGIVRYDNSNWEIFNSDNSGVDIDYINAISIDKEQKKWIYTNQYVIEYNDMTWTIHTHLDYRWRGEMHMGNGNDKWFTGGLGLTKFTGTYYQHYTMDNSGLPANWCFSFAIDEKGNKWVATVGGVGVYNEEGVDISSTPTSHSVIPSLPVQEIRISPNPAVSSININAHSWQRQKNETDIDIHVYDVAGNNIKHVILPYSNQASLDIDDLTPGIYIVKIKYGDKYEQAKFIKK